MCILSVFSAVEDNKLQKHKFSFHIWVQLCFYWFPVVSQFPLLSMPSSFPGSIPCCWAIFCTSNPMCFRNWMTLISCPVSWSRMVGQDGLQCGHGQLSTRYVGQPLIGGVLCFKWLWFPWLTLVLSWRLRSQQWRALGNEVPLTWMSIQWLQTQEDD